MRAGLLDNIIQIQTPHQIINEFGEQELTYINKATCKAREVQYYGNRAILNSEILHEYQKTFEVWMFVKICETNYILFEGKQYRILSIYTDKKQQKKIIKTELVND